MDKPNVHLGSPVIMVRYETPELSGQPRAAFVSKGPFLIPDGPHEGEWGANIMWLVNDIGTNDMENGDPIYVDGVPTDSVVYTGMDRRRNVPYDPSGLTPRSFHIWGEAEGEE